jgi:hypothetical protein
MQAIKLVRTWQVRGATEHFYRAIEGPLISDEEYKEVSVEDRNGFGQLILQRSLVDASTSIDDGIFGERHDHHISRVPLLVDEEGWAELRKIYADTLDATLQLQAASAERMNGDSDAAAIPTRAISMFFEMPDNLGR